jgi:ABC transporter substrate binding protein (PQQ-dependent alcohol dehydrogenase system)
MPQRLKKLPKLIPIRLSAQNPDFGVAAFKGQKVSFRAWNHQMRQPIAIATTELPVSWSPQPGFLHQRSEVDTLGIDEPESKCQLQ